VTSSHGIYVFFQITTAALLLAAASSSFQAGPGLLKALARRGTSDGHGVGILPSWMGRTNEHHTPYWAVVLFLAVSVLVTVASQANEQVLVLYYAVSVFMSFFVALLAMARFSRQERRGKSLLMNGVGALIVAFTLAVDLSRGQPLAAVAASLLIAAGLYRQWTRAGRPRGIAGVLSDAEGPD
jgi:amino acid transporter